MKKIRILSLLFTLLAVLSLPADAAVIEVVQGQQNYPGVNLGTAQTTNVDTTNTMDRGAMRGPVLLKLVTTIGATPTVTVNILGSMDGTNFYNVAYAVSGTPETPVVAAIVITTATTNFYILRPAHPWRYLKLNYSANTNVTITADVYP
jgi:hypothetical protein